jgi:hypothetical protein
MKVSFGPEMDGMGLAALLVRGQRDGVSGAKGRLLLACCSSSDSQPNDGCS